MLEVFVVLKLNQKSSIHEETVVEEAHLVLMEENEIVVDSDLLESMARKLGTLRKAKKITIFHVPYKFHQSKENLFEPSAVSIGPFHRGRKRVRSMEEQKWRFLRDFLSREDHISLDRCLAEMKHLEETTRSCYSESVDLHSDGFVEMMLLDGCFVLEYFLKWYKRRSNSVGHSVFIISDLLLLENQIPFFIVDKLCKIGLKPDTRRDFTNYLVNVFARAARQVYDDSINEDSKIEIPPDEIDHLVHLCYQILIPIDPSKPVVVSSESFCPAMLSRIKNLLLEFPLWVLTIIFPKRRKFLALRLSVPKSTLIPCATELQNAGIKLRPTSNPNHMLDISFHDRVLEIPRLTITDESKTLLANLIAFEQSKLDENQEMHANLSSFALLLDSLVNTPEDVKILKKCGIVNNCLDSDEELTNFFNQICKGMLVEKDHFMAELFTAVKSYCDSSWGKRRARWNRHKTQFIDTYFSNPWTAISLVAAVFVLLLTCVTSFYAVYAYYIPPS